jgi:hypothetical protein
MAMKKKTMAILLLLAAGWALVPAQRADAQAPLPSSSRYSLSINGQTYGPYGMDQLPQMVQQGTLTGETLVWKEGMAQWAAAGAVQELSPLFSVGGAPPIAPSAPAQPVPQQLRRRVEAPAQSAPAPAQPASRQPAPRQRAPAPAAPVEADAQDFSTGSRIGAAALNPLLGLGSSMMGDWLGGLVVTGLEGFAVGCIFWEMSLDKDDALYLAPGAMVFVAGGAAVLFGIIKPLFYHRPPATKKAAALMNGMDIAIVQAAGTPRPMGMNAAPGVRLSYRFQF